MSVTDACTVPWSVRIVHTYIPLSPTVAFLIWRVPLMIECLPVGSDPSSLDQDTVVSTFFSGRHLNMADWSRATVITAGVTTIPGAGITFPDSPLNGCREVWVGEVGSPGSPFSPFIPGGPGRPGYPGGPCGPCGPIFPGGPCTQIWLLLVQIFLVAVLTDWVICCCISGDNASLSPLEDSTSRTFLCRVEELIDSTIEERISVRKD